MSSNIGHDLATFAQGKVLLLLKTKSIFITAFNIYLNTKFNAVHSSC